jgi:hypothetical protein
MNEAINFETINELITYVFINHPTYNEILELLNNFNTQNNNKELN